MAVEDAAPQADSDLVSISEARALPRAASQAQRQLAELSQEQIDAIVTAMAQAVTPHAEALARLAVEETGYGVVADKTQKISRILSGLRVHPTHQDRGRREPDRG